MMTNRYAQVADGRVVNIVLWDGGSPLKTDNPLIPIPDAAPVAIGYGYANGTFMAPAEPAPRPATVGEIRAAIQAHMDRKAQEMGYDGITSAVTYADEPAVPKFQAEGIAFREWRSLVWQAGYAYLAEVQAGTKPMPTVEEAIALLPPLELPA
ncbi:hypothetical protein NDR89_19900 [Cupriavidus gilardii]|uniref:Phage tail protein n=1 Tax=Cupriavidus gilardii TaxID=82541 RepID=A0ABY4VNT7_9BURK|nr:hypothetical protein [Cupriavidus gilardii]USE78901.1 hypothetical protein NDR89_19900 [Cupriavidus gilardii]